MNWFTSLIAQIAIIITLPIMIPIGIANWIHGWCLKQCKDVW